MPSKSSMNPKLSEDIHTSIYSLNELLREAGVKEICKILERILESPDEIAALYAAFASRLKAPKKREDDSAITERRAWFRGFLSKDGKCLEPKEINTLTDITSCWALSVDQIKILVACSKLWSNRPELFWYGDTADEDLIRRCCNDLRRTEEVDPLRRRVILMILSQQVEQEQYQLPSKGRRGRSKPSKNRGGEGRVRQRVFLASAVHSLTKRLWPQLQPKEQNNTRERLSFDSRYGWKWRQLAETEMVLSLQGAATKKFERHCWTPIEIEAIDQFIQSLPQYNIQPHLREAMDSIMSYYSRNTNLNEPRSTSGDLQTSSDIVATPNSRSCRVVEDSRSQGLEGHSFNTQSSPRVLPLENQRFPNNDAATLLISDDANAAETLPTSQIDSRALEARECSDSRGVDSRGVHQMEKSATEAHIRSILDPNSGTQYRAPTPQTNLEPQVVCNPLPPFSEDFPPTNWDSTYSLSQLNDQREEWDTSCPQNTLDIHIDEPTMIPQPVSNPLLPFSPSDWGSHMNEVQEGIDMINSLPNPLAPFDARFLPFQF